jgi:hypothetical protein
LYRSARVSQGRTVLYTRSASSAISPPSARRAMSEPTVALKKATSLEHPFNKPTADVILRSKDGIEFKVHKFILAESSPLFEDLFSLPQTIPGSPRSSNIRILSQDDSDLPVIDMTEDSYVINDLLHFVYPIPDPTFSSISRAAAVMGAAQKYQMSEALSLTSKQMGLFAQKEPLRVFALGCHYKNFDLARLAALLGVGKSQMRAPVEELDLITGRVYCRLLCHLEALHKIDKDLSQASGYAWIPQGLPSLIPPNGGNRVEWNASVIPSWFSCGQPESVCSYARGADGQAFKYRAPISQSNWFIKAWWRDYMDAVVLAMKTQGYSGDRATSEPIVNAAIQTASSCASSCGQHNNVQAFRAFTEFLKEEIDGRLTEVRLGRNPHRTQHKY